MDNNKKKLAKVYHFDLYGKRQEKYENSIDSVKWTEVENKEPNYFFVPKDYELLEKYEKGFSVKKLFPVNGVGICSKRDKIAFQFEKETLINILNDFNNLTEEELKIKYKVKSESRDQKVSYAKNNIINKGIENSFIKEINYRIFDKRWTYHTNISKGFLAYPVYNVMQHLSYKNNFGLITNREQKIGFFDSLFISKNIIDLHIVDNGSYIFPLYLYPDSKTDGVFTKKARTSNLNPDIVKQFSEKLDLEFTNEKEEKENTFAPIDILDYIYAVLHSPAYREKYKEFLKIDFPRVPFPTTLQKFKTFVELGAELRQIHLLESPKVDNLITTYPVDGDNTITTKIGRKDWQIKEEQNPVTPSCSQGRIYINDTQYFDNIPLVAWEFYIGGYQPAQKWLKDRRGRTLDFEDVLHYQKIIVALSETDRLMKAIDEVGIE